MTDTQFVQITALPDPPARPDDAHKGTFGTVIVVGGSSTMPGAPAICARAAFRAGAGLVKIASAPDVLATAIAIEPGATGIALGTRTSGGSDAHQQRQAIDHADPEQLAVLAIGPGMGTSDAAGRLVENLLRTNRPVVLDADGLNLIAQSSYRHRTGEHPLVLTPHPGEYRRLAQRLGLDFDPTDPGQRPAAAAALADAHRAVVVLKGHRTIVTDGKQLYTNATGNPALATAGSGDVLTGLLAALIAQGMDAFNAAVCAVHAHGRAADLWAQKHGKRGLLARELADGIPEALAR